MGQHSRSKPDKTQGLDQALEQAVVLETSPSTVIVMPTGGRILATKPVPPVQDQHPWNSEEASAEAVPNPNKRIQTSHIYHYDESNGIVAASKIKTTKKVEKKKKKKKKKN